MSCKKMKKAFLEGKIKGNAVDTIIMDEVEPTPLRGQNKVAAMLDEVGLFDKKATKKAVKGKKK